VHYLVVPVSGRGHHEDFTVQQLETGVNRFDQPGQITSGEATGRRGRQQHHLPVYRLLGRQGAGGSHAIRVHLRTLIHRYAAHPHGGVPRRLHLTSGTGVADGKLDVPVLAVPPGGYRDGAEDATTVPPAAIATTVVIAWLL
jgi:hypothetical protein